MQVYCEGQDEEILRVREDSKEKAGWGGQSILKFAAGTSNWYERCRALKRSSIMPFWPMVTVLKRVVIGLLKQREGQSRPDRRRGPMVFHRPVDETGISVGRATPCLKLWLQNLDPHRLPFSMGGTSSDLADVAAKELVSPKCRSSVSE